MTPDEYRAEFERWFQTQDTERLSPAQVHDICDRAFTIGAVLGLRDGRHIAAEEILAGCARGLQTSTGGYIAREGA